MMTSEEIRMIDEILRRMLTLIDEKDIVTTDTLKMVFAGDYIVMLDIEGTLTIYKKEFEVMGGKR